MSAPQEIRFDLSGAAALLLTSEALETTSEGAALTADEAVSNLKKLASDGSLQNVIRVVETSSGPKTVKYPVQIFNLTLGRMDEVYVGFTGPGVLLDGEQCVFAVVLPPSEAKCIEAEAEIGSWAMRFDTEGNLYYYAEEPTVSGGQTVVKRFGIDGALETLLVPEAIHLHIINEFVPLNDGSVVFFGNLEGTSDNLFRYDSNLKKLEPLNGQVSGSFPGLSDALGDTYVTFMEGFDGRLYAQTNKGLIEAELADNGLLEMKAIELPEADGSYSLPFRFSTDFERSPNGQVYALDRSNLLVARIYPDVSWIPLPSMDIEQIRMVGDYMYMSGTQAGQYKFLRVSTDNASDVADLLGGRDMLIQNFDISDNGDVYFGALDLDTTTVGFFRFKAEDESLELMESLPSKLLQIEIL